MRSPNTFTNKVIKEQLALKALSNKDFADQLGISLSSLYNRFHSKRSWKIEEVVRASELFGLPVSAFFASEQVSA